MLLKKMCGELKYVNIFIQHKAYDYHKTTSLYYTSTLHHSCATQVVITLFKMYL